VNRVGVLLVNYRQWDMTRRCVETLLESEGVEVIPALTDNSSPGPVPSWVGSIPALRFLRQETNTGFTSGTNTAFSLVKDDDTDFVFVLNNDTEVFPDSIRLLTDHLDANPDAGIATPAILYAGRPELVWSAGGVLSPIQLKSRQSYGRVGDLPDGPVKCSFASGCAIMMRTADFAGLGGLDDGLFIYCDDNDLSLKVMESGRDIVLVPQSRILHHVSVTVGGSLSPMSVYFTHRNRCIVALRHLSGIRRPLFVLYYLLLTLAKSLVYPVRRRPELVGWMWKALAHGLSGRTGTIPDGVLP
jgi:GT2 family glycosyltransferase